MNGDVRFTERPGRATVIAACIDVPRVILIGRRVSSELFGKLKWHLAAAAFLVYAALWGSYGSVDFWDVGLCAYSRLGHDESCRRRNGRAVRRAGPRVLAGEHFGRTLAVGLVLALLGGLVSLVGHGIGIRRVLLTVPPLAEASAVLALTFGVFEFVFYWCVIVDLAVEARKFCMGVRRPAG